METTELAGMPNIDWDTDVLGTASVGKSMTYKVTVSNRGTAPGKVELAVDLPANVERVQENPPAAAVTGPRTKAVRFPELVLPPGKTATYPLEVKARAAGEARAVFCLSGDGIGRTRRGQAQVRNVAGPRAAVHGPAARDRAGPRARRGRAPTGVRPSVDRPRGMMNVRAKDRGAEAAAQQDRPSWLNRLESLTPNW